MRKIISIVFVFLCSHAYCQSSFFATAFLGLSGYNGDLDEGVVTLVRAKPAFGVGISYEINERMMIQSDLYFGRIFASDKYNTKNRARNLSFNSNIFEYSIAFDYVLFNLYTVKASPYGFMGAAIFSFNPYIDMEDGNRIMLYDYSTEGQGFYQDRKKYKLRQFSIPFGGGVLYAISDKVRLGFELGIRKTFTDYLDDVSTNYVDKDLLQQNKGFLAPQIAYRGDLLPGGAPYPADGTMRGNPKNKDMYYFTGLSVKYRISPEGKAGKFKNAGSVVCPAL